MRISDWSSDVCSSDLPGKEGQFLDPPQPVRVRAIEHRRHVFRLHLAIADAAVLGLHLNERFYGKQAARPGAHNLAPHVGQGPRKRIGPKRDRGHVAADENSRHSATCHAMRPSPPTPTPAPGRPPTTPIGPPPHSHTNN